MTDLNIGDTVFVLSRFFPQFLEKVVIKAVEEQIAFLTVDGNDVKISKQSIGEQFKEINSKHEEYIFIKYSEDIAKRYESKQAFSNLIERINFLVNTVYRLNFAYRAKINTNLELINKATASIEKAIEVLTETENSISKSLEVNHENHK